jgi:NifB/MoaA-like Fe-S oxidoreductase
VKFVSDKGVKPREKPESKPKPTPFRCEYCGKERHLVEFCYKRKREERLPREQANQDRYR